MKVSLADVLIGIKNGKTNKKELKGFIEAINQSKANKKILESLHVGLSNFADRDVIKFVEIIK
jgi:hypothetical protein